MVVVLWSLFAVAAAVDWWAVGTDRPDVERVAKPATLALLCGVALAIEPADPTVRGWFVAALVLSLAGDVFLLPQVDQFVLGLGSFLLGHLAYIGGFVVAGIDSSDVVIAAFAITSIALLIGPRIVAGARRHDASLTVPVIAYITVISVMVVAAVGAGPEVAAVGALLFYVSDACIGWSRFVAEFAHHRLAIVTTYHLGQAALVASLVVGA